MHKRLLFTLMVAALATAGCGSHGSGSVTGPGDTSNAGSATDTDGGPGGTQGGSSLYAGASTNAACKTVDLLIAVDDSGSMQEEMDAMRDTVFPSFARALRDIGGGLDDYRVGVSDACPSPSTLHVRGEGGMCNFSTGVNFMDSDSPDLAREFSCVGDIWSGDRACSGDNDDEQPASAAAAVLEANGQFLRDDALLVVVAITDEDEQPDPSMAPAPLFERLVAIKGDVRRMVFLGIGGASDCEGLYGRADEARYLVELTNMFVAEDRGVFWDLCGGALEDGLTEAMRVIEGACQDLPDLPCSEFSDEWSPDCDGTIPPEPAPQDAGLI